AKGAAAGGRPAAEQPAERRSTVKFFLDTANVNEIREAASMGVLDGVTTNPSLVAKEGRDFVETLKEITSIVDGPVSAGGASPTHDDKRAARTRSPRLVERGGRAFVETLKEIPSIVDGPISAEVVSTTYDEMLREAEPLV